MLLLLAQLVAVATSIQTVAVVHDIRSYGAVAGTQSAYKTNQASVNKALAAAAVGDTVLVPAGLTFYAMGGMYVSGKQSLTFQLDGNLTSVADFQAWPAPGQEYKQFLEFHNCSDITMTSSTGDGVVDGTGIPWWERYIIGECGVNVFKNKTIYCPKRPKLVMFSNSEHVLVEKVTLVNSPSFNLQLNQVKHAEVRYINVNTDIQASTPESQD